MTQDIKYPYPPKRIAVLSLPIYKPHKHPMQYRIDENKQIPSLWCGVKYFPT